MSPGRGGGGAHENGEVERGVCAPAVSRKRRREAIFPLSVLSPCIIVDKIR